MTLRREAIFTVGNAITTMDIEKLHSMVTTGMIDIHGYLKGLTVLTSYDLLLSILQTIELFILIDEKFDYVCDQSMKNVFIKGCGLDYLE